MNKLFDLRFVIGCFFGVTGLLLLIYSLMAEEGSKINLTCGTLFLVFGVLMLFFSMRKGNDQ